MDKERLLTIKTNKMKRIFLSIALLAASLTMKAQCHTYGDTLINYTVIPDTSEDTTYLSVTFYVVESPNKYAMMSSKFGSLVYAYSSSAPMSDDLKKVSIKMMVDAWINKNYPTW